MSRAQGDHYELMAKQYLTKAHCKIIATNYLAPCGELDLIIQDNKEIAFVEVKYRKNNAFGGAISAVSKSKQAKIIKTAQHYLVKNKKYDKMPCRFDVLCISGQLHIEWLKSAFIMSTHF
jgi:putative endonuclease